MFHATTQILAWTKQYHKCRNVQGIQNSYNIRVDFFEEFYSTVQTSSLHTIGTHDKLTVGWFRLIEFGLMKC